MGRLGDTNLDGMQQIHQTYDIQRYDTRILAAAIWSTNHLGDAVRAEADAATAPAAVLRGLTRHALTIGCTPPRSADLTESYTTRTANLGTSLTDYGNEVFAQVQEGIGSKMGAHGYQTFWA